MLDREKIAEESVRSGFFLASGTAIATSVMAVSTILIGRFLGPELYGQYSLAFVVPQLFFLLTDLGLSQAVIKFTASLKLKGEASRLKKILELALLLRVSIGIALFCVTYVLADVLSSTFLQRPDLAFYVRAASFSILFQVIFATVTSAFIGLDKSEYNALTTSLQAIGKAVASVALVLLGYGVAGAIVGYVASYAIAGAAGGVILFLILRQMRNIKESQRSRNDLRDVLRYGIPLYLSIIVTALTPFYQNLILAIYVTDAEIGNYKAAVNFAVLMTVLSVPIASALLPTFSKIESAAKREMKSFFKIAHKYTTLVIVPIALLMILYSTEIVKTIYGTTYQSAPSFLATYCSLYLLVGLGYITLSSFYNGLGETKITFTTSLITFMVLLVLSPILAKIYAVQGIIVAFLLASLAGTVYALHTARTRFQIAFDTRMLAKIYLVSVLSSIPCLLVSYFLSLPILLNFVGGGIVYLLLYIVMTPITGILTYDEVQTALRVIQRIRILRIFAVPVLKLQKMILEFRMRVHVD